MPDGIRLAAHIQNAPDLWLLAAAFTGSLCLFLLELFAGKFLLPRFGGALAVWVSCMAFFQVALVAGYFFADRVGHCIAFFVICVALHDRLVDSRPPAGQLTVFSLAMATGGALGGLFNRDCWPPPPAWCRACLQVALSGWSRSVPRPWSRCSRSTTGSGR